MSGALMHKLAILMLAASLAGCATAAQQQSQRMGATLRESASAARSCFDAVNADPAFAVLRAKLAIGSDAPGLDRLSDTGKPNAEERQLLIRYHAAVAPCRRAAIDGASQALPELASAAQDWFATNDQALLALVQGRATWGDTIQAMTAARRTFVSREVGIRQRAAAELNRQHSAELEQRQRRSAALMAASYAMQQQALQQQMINAANRPVTTNCIRTGNVVNCSSN